MAQNNAALAEAYRKPLSSHLYHEVSAHLMRAHRRRIILEWMNWVDPLLVEPYRVKNGHLIIPERPGVGLEFNRDVIDQTQGQTLNPPDLRSMKRRTSRSLLTTLKDCCLNRHYCPALSVLFQAPMKKITDTTCTDKNQTKPKQNIDILGHQSNHRWTQHKTAIAEGSHARQTLSGSHKWVIRCTRAPQW